MGLPVRLARRRFQDIMRTVEGEPYADVLSMMLLRSMQQARYSEHNHGHYGLAADYYTHFTSPHSPLSRPSSSPYDSGLRPF